MFIEDLLYKEILSCLPVSCVDVLIRHNGKILLLKRDNEPAKGEYWFPGGRIQKNETIIAAALRKAKEETNLDCIFEKIVSIEESFFPELEDQISLHTINICCLLDCLYVSNIDLDKFHSEYKWVDHLELNYRQEIIRPLTLIGFKQGRA